MRACLVSICALAALVSQGFAAERWRSQYFYDEDSGTLVFADIQCPSAIRCLAVGSVMDGKGGRKPVQVLTADGGKTWSNSKLQEHPVSLFFLNEGLGWMVTENSQLWQTTEVGRNWKQVGKIPGQALRVFFATENDGWAAGGKKGVFETHDGGHRWTPVPAAAEPPGEARYSAYTCVAFAGKSIGLITGWNIPPHNESETHLPEWMDPETRPRRVVPHLSYSLLTADGGKTWHASSGSLIGEVSRLRLGENGAGLGLMEYPRGFTYPSEVYRIDTHTAKSSTAYRDRNFHVTDIWLAPDGAAYLAGRVAQGQAWNLTPGKVRILRSADWKSWVELEVYYRAEANRVLLAGAPDGTMWAATDAGMILRLVP